MRSVGGAGLTDLGGEAFVDAAKPRIGRVVQPEQSLGHDELIDLERTAVGENDPFGIQSEPLEAVSDEVGGLPTTREGMEEEVIEVRRRVLVEDPERRQRLSDEMAVISAHEDDRDTLLDRVRDAHPRGARSDRDSPSSPDRPRGRCSVRSAVTLIPSASKTQPASSMRPSLPIVTACGVTKPWRTVSDAESKPLSVTTRPRTRRLARPPIASRSRSLSLQACFDDAPKRPRRSPRRRGWRRRPTTTRQ